MIRMTIEVGQCGEIFEGDELNVAARLKISKVQILDTVNHKALVNHITEKMMANLKKILEEECDRIRKQK